MDNTQNAPPLRSVSTACVLFIVIVCCCAVCGCSESTDNPESESPDSIRHVVERGPLRVVTEVSPAAPRLSDEPTFTLTYEYEKGVTLNKPPFGNSLGDFEILGFREPPVSVVGDRQVEQQVYRLEPTTAGELTIAPIVVTFRDGRKDIGDQQQHELTTEPIVVPVTTMLSDEAPQLSDLRPPAPPVSLPKRFEFWSLAWLILPAFLAAALFWWLRRRRDTESIEPMFSPREIAEAALRELERSNIAQTDVKQFYVELTGIVRRYLEQTSGVRAPEQTTEEFLRDIADHQSFGGEQRERLRQFLGSADLVKFAGHQPSADDVQESFQRARRFIEFAWSSTSTEVAA